MNFYSNRIGLLCIVNLLMLGACKNYSKEVIQVSSIEDFIETPVRYVIGRSMNLFPDNHFVSASNLMFLENILVIHRTSAAPHYFEAYNVKTSEKIGFFGLQGNGPNELPYRGLSSINDQSKKSLGLIIHNDGGSYYEFDLSNFINDTASVKWEPLTQFGYGDANTFVKISDTVFAMLSLSSEERLTLMGLSGKRLGSFFDYPFESELSEIPKNLLGMVHQGLLVKNDNLKRLGIFNYQSVCWEIIDFQDPLKLKRIAKMHLSKPVAFDASERLSENSVSISVAFAANSPVAFLDVVASNDNIFALYGGRNFDEHGSEVLLGNQVYVLDWNGNVLDKIQLDKDTNCIAVNEEGTSLYCLVEDNGKDDVYEYRID